MNPRIRNILDLCFSLLLVFLVAGISGMVTASNTGGWYQQLDKPSWQPPDWVFGPVWTGLYILMAVAAWLVWLQRDRFGRKLRVAMSVYLVQLLVNGLWSPVFFGLHEVGLALALVCLLWVCVLLTVLLFSTVRPLAGWLLLPYLAWITFAGVLNYVLWKANG